MSFDTYIINLKQDVDKYNRMASRLHDVGIKYNRFDAIYGKNVKNEYDQYISTYKEFIPRSIIGCGLSHFLTCKNHFNQDNKKVALIIEDDAVPLFKDKNSINQIISDAPKDWEIILLYTQGKTNYKDNTWDAGPCMGSTMAYLINYKGFKKRYDNYKLSTHTDVERGLSNCIVYKTPQMYFEPEFSESSTSSLYNKSLAPLYNFFDSLYFEELETDITGFSGSMLSRYKLLRLPYIDIEFDILEMTFLICILVSLVFILSSKNRFYTTYNCIYYSFVFVALILAVFKIFLSIF